MSKQKTISFIVIIGIVAGIIILAVLNYPPKIENPTEKETETTEKETGKEEKTQEDSQQVADGLKEEEYGFNVSSAAGVYPKFISGKFSKRPPEVKGGENFNASIKAEDPDGISTVKLTLVGQEDSLKEEIQLELVEGDEFSGVWQGSLIIPDEWTKISWTNFYTQNKLGETEDLNLRW